VSPRAALEARLALAGIVAGTCDIAYALLFFGWKGVPAERILQSIASGLLGTDAFQDGWVSAATGLGLHYAIATVAAVLFWRTARHWAWLRREPITAGLVFGLLIYAFMNFVVLPLSAYPFPMTFPLLRTATGVLVHMVGVGLPISLITRRAHPVQESA
jgi:uncharacterized membrane protein YagU involved in acid resistance